ncbi:MAG: hypothetical protein IKE36_07620 [Solobacterium sp.]|nr:hypothetical protein [Solobacterium sp.]
MTTFSLMSLVRNDHTQDTQNTKSLIQIYIGLNDMDTKIQKFETSKYLSVLKNVCISYQVPFSVNVIEGGYIHESGEYTMETSLVLSLIDVKKTIVEEIARDLCTFFHQESVLITEDRLRTYFISNSRDLDPEE